MKKLSSKHLKKVISTKNLIDKLDMNRQEEIAEQFWKQTEKEASEHELTVDYYLAEFYTT